MKDVPVKMLLQSVTVVAFIVWALIEQKKLFKKDREIRIIYYCITTLTHMLLCQHYALQPKKKNK